MENVKKGYKVVVDMSAIPDKMDPVTFVKLADSGYIFYDSTKGSRPKLYPIIDNAFEVEPVICDVNGKEVDLSTIQKLWIEQDYWDKEMFKCKASPIHYFTNYVSVSPKPTDSDISNYLEAIGLGKEEGDKISDEVKQKRIDYSKSINLETLKCLKSARIVIEDKYNKVTEELYEEASELYEISSKDILVKKLHSEIMKTPARKAVGLVSEFVDKKKNSWDLQLMRVTDFDVIIRAWKELQN